MSFQIKKLTKIIGVSLLTLPLAFTNVVGAAETVDERIKKLEEMVKDLKQNQKKIKKKT